MILWLTVLTVYFDGIIQVGNRRGFVDLLSWAEAEVQACCVVSRTARPPATLPKEQLPGPAASGSTCKAMWTPRKASCSGNASRLQPSYVSWHLEKFQITSCLEGWVFVFFFNLWMFKIVSCFGILACVVYHENSSSCIKCNYFTEDRMLFLLICL